MQILQNEKQKAQLVLLNANFIWGITPIFLQVVLSYITPLHATTLRFGIAVITLTLLLYFLKGREMFSLLSSKILVILGWLDAFGYLAVTIGQDMTTPGLATLIGSFYVFIVPFLSWKFEDSKVSNRIVLIGSTSLLGIFLISFNGDWSNLSNSSFNGTLILVFSALMWGFYTVITSKYLTKSKIIGEKIDLFIFTYSSLFHTTVALSILSLLVAEPLIIPSTSIILELIPLIFFLGIFPTIIALGSWNWAITRLGSISTSFYQLLQILIPFVLEFILFHQVYTIWIYSGISLVLVSSLLITENDEPTEHAQETSLLKNQVTDSSDAGSIKITNDSPIQCCF